MKRERTLRICPMGHRYYKSTDCGTCPKCEQANKPSEGYWIFDITYTKTCTR